MSDKNKAPSKVQAILRQILHNTSNEAKHVNGTENEQMPHPTEYTKTWTHTMMLMV
jgi:hypothetical protein